MIRYSCDGCGKEIDEPKHRGWVLKREYCDNCADVADDYMSEYDSAHDKAAKDFLKFVNSLKTKYGKKLNALPDTE